MVGGAVVDPLFETAPFCEVVEIGIVEVVKPEAVVD